jgi:hypothetical protein
VGREVAGADLAVEGAGGLGHLLAQQLVAVGELVLDLQPKLAARVRLLDADDSSKNDPNDAAGQARIDLAADILADMRRLHEQMLESKKKLASAVRASG